ncbi:MAG: hypothetical protein DRQ44_02235, partial [Gammaproteobacteria bacterium]
MVEQSHTRPRVIYLPVLMIWMLFLVIIMTGIILSDLSTAKHQFHDSVNSSYTQASDRVRINETVLEGFAALVSSMHELDRPHIRKYAQEMLKQYPHIFMFEILETVPYEKLEAFSKRYRATVDPDFKIKAFSYETNRKIKSIEKKHLYMPVVFMEPFPPGSHEVLGLDLHSHEFFSRSLKKSALAKHSVITEPFQSIEGDLAYLIYKPVSIKKTAKNQQEIQRIVVLVITADTLLNGEHQATEGMTELLHHPDFDVTNEKGHMYLRRADGRSRLEKLVFPRYTNSIALDNESQPFVLVNEYQLGWDVLSWYLLIVTLLIGIVSFVALMIFARIYHISEINRLQAADKWFYMAHHDALTGLASRYLFFDRLKHALLHAKRLQISLAVIFIDLNDFKVINDSYGHDVGDR